MDFVQECFKALKEKADSDIKFLSKPDYQEKLIDMVKNKLKKLTTSSKNYMTKKSVENCFNNFIKSKKSQKFIDPTFLSL